MPSRRTQIYVQYYAVCCAKEPFDSLDLKYLRPLSTDCEDDQKADLNKCLRIFNLDGLLGALFEFIETYIRTSPDDSLDRP